MDPAEQGPKPPFLRHGDNALSPLILREVAVLSWSLMEDGEGTHIEALLNGWRQLAREERWWLYARASNPSQRQGQGWRRALYFALTDPADTRTAPRLLEIMEAATAQKKLPRRHAPSVTDRKSTGSERRQPACAARPAPSRRRNAVRPRPELSTLNSQPSTAANGSKQPARPLLMANRDLVKM